MNKKTTKTKHKATKRAATHKLKVDVYIGYTAKRIKGASVKQEQLAGYMENGKMHPVIIKDTDNKGNWLGIELLSVQCIYINGVKVK